MNRWMTMLLIMFAATLAACGGDGGTDDEVAGAADPDAPVTSAARDSGSIDESSTPTDGTGANGNPDNNSENNADTDGDDTAQGAGDAAADAPGTDGTVAGQGAPLEPPVREDDLLLVFEDGALGPVVLGSTRDDMIAILGPEFRISPVETVRAGFPAGYSVSWQGEVLFWVIEEDGEAVLFMTNNSRVGLESGLRPRLPLADAIEMHGEPTLALGPEQREFASFSDGTGGDGPVSVLVSIGEFGGPVGLYDGLGGDVLEEADGYVLDDANVKELWFGASPG